MRSGSEYTGLLRWTDEEAFWGDLFNSMKDELPYQDEDMLEELEEDYGRRRDRDGGSGTIRVLGYKIQWGGDSWGGSRQFMARFGDIEAIRVFDDDEAEIVMRSGSVYRVSGYSNDVGATIHVKDDSLGEIQLKWDKIETIQFLPTPASVSPGTYRLHGRVMTDTGSFVGYIQWDSQECLDTDLLDGESEDGKMSIEMGRIRSIERRGRRSSVVELKDGRELRLRGTNDVNQDIRGIFVEDERYGRVKVSWDAFDRAEFDDRGGSGPSYADFGDGYPLDGTIHTREGERLSGRIVFDLDEAESWEILNGSKDDVEYYIPFSMIAAIEPGGRDDSIVVLRSGEEIRLEDGQDVSDSNDGILVFEDEDPLYVHWDDVDRIDFRH
jgi:hypothetical protein